jgi:abhydrolase domain-containing protein 11
MAYTSYESTKPSLTSTSWPVIIMHGLLGSKANWNAMSKMLHSKTNRKVRIILHCLLMYLFVVHVFTFTYVIFKCCAHHECFQVFAVDARNHGDSPHSNELSYNHLVEDLRSLMSDLAIKRSTFIGHSMGGRAVMLLGLKYVS